MTDGDTVPSRLKPNVGLRIQAIRERCGYSLRALSRRCSLSTNAISRIERGENSPTVSSLHILAEALDVPITDFFTEEDRQATVFVSRDCRLRTQGSGFVMESLGIGLTNQQLEPFLMIIQPEIKCTNESVTHHGEEFAYCLSGEVLCTIENNSFRLTIGDSVLFEADQPHNYYNATKSPATILLVFQATQSKYLAQRRHLGI